MREVESVRSFWIPCTVVPVKLGFVGEIIPSKGLYFIVLNDMSKVPIDLTSAKNFRGLKVKKWPFANISSSVSSRAKIVIVKFVA